MNTLLYMQIIPFVLIFFLLRLAEKRLEIHKSKRKNTINYDCISEKQHYLKQFRKRIRFLTLLFSIAVIIALAGLFYFGVYKQISIHFDQETISRRLKNGYKFLGFMSLLLFALVLFAYLYLKRRYKSYEPVILGMPQDDFEFLLKCEEYNLFYEKFFSDYLICKNYLYLFMIGQLIEINIQDIEHIKDLGHIRPFRGSSYYSVRLILKNKRKFSIRSSTELEHDFLIERISFLLDRIYFIKQNKL